LFAIVIASVAGFLLGPRASWVMPAQDPAFAVTMFFTGTLVTTTELRDLKRKPAYVAVGLAGQFILMPLIAWLLSRFVDNDPTLQQGLLLLGCMPTAMASNVMTVLLEGEVALAVSLTTVATILSPLVILLVLQPLFGVQNNAKVYEIAFKALYLVAIPVTVGVAIRKKFGDRFPPWWKRAATFVAGASITFIIFIVVVKNGAHIAKLGPNLTLILLALNMVGYAGAHGVGHVLDWPPSVQRTITVDVGMKNAGMAAVLGQQLGGAAPIPGAIYAVLCLLTVSIALPLRKRWTQRDSDTDGAEVRNAVAARKDSV
ncbi:MAG TPA: bile acid:sodium symporter family protein, partial [Polyangium sp.]|nr:bile acid:sodium symporter family protein [Polyangium sp.]